MNTRGEYTGPSGCLRPLIDVFIPADVIKRKKPFRFEEELDANNNGVVRWINKSII